MKSNTKKSTKILGIILVLAMLGSPLAYFAKTNTTSANENTLETEAAVKESLPDRSIDEIKKNITKEDIKTEGNKVIGNIQVDENVSTKDAEKLIQQYTQELSKKNVGKDISLKIVRNKQEIAKSSTYKNKQSEQEKNLPKYTVKIENGLSLADRYVAVTLEVVNSDNYYISVFNSKLKYVPEKNFFHGIVNSSNEEDILKNIKIMMNK